MLIDQSSTVDPRSHGRGGPTPPVGHEREVYALRSIVHGDAGLWCHSTTVSFLSGWRESPCEDTLKQIDLRLRPGTPVNMFSPLAPKGSVALHIRLNRAPVAKFG